MPQDVDAILAGAKKVAANAEAKFPSAGASKVVTPPAKPNDYSHAPYTLASEARDAAEGIKSRRDIQKKALQ